MDVNAFLKELAREICAGRDLQFAHPGRYDRNGTNGYVETEGKIDIWHKQRQEECFTLELFECENEDIIECCFTEGDEKWSDAEQFSIINLDPSKVAKYMFRIWAKFLKETQKDAREIVETTTAALKEVENDKR